MDFKHAPDHQTYLLPSLIHYHAKHNGSHPFQINYINGEWHTTTHANFAALVSGAATALFAAEYMLPLRRAGDDDEPPVVTVLGGSDVTSLAVYIALMNRGCAVSKLRKRAPEGSTALTAFASSRRFLSRLALLLRLSLRC